MSRFEIGDRVRLIGFTGENAHLNGLVGTVVREAHPHLQEQIFAYLAGRGRSDWYGVHGDDLPAEIACVHESRLEPVEDEDRALYEQGWRELQETLGYRAPAAVKR